MLRFGISTTPAGPDETGLLDAAVARGDTWLELSFTQGFPWKEKECRRFGEAAAARGVGLSVHAPYFAVLTVEDEERSRRCLAAVEHTMKLGRALGASTVCVHPGPLGERRPEDVLDLVVARLAGLAPKLEGLGVGLGLETAGSVGGFGTLGDIALVAAEIPFVRPIVDWAHVHARSGGALRDAAAFRAVLDTVLSSFPAWKVHPLHTQLSDVLYGPSGEIRHLPYGEGTLRAAPLVEAATGVGIDLVVVSESRDDPSHDAIRREVRAALSGGSGVPGGGGRPVATRLSDAPDPLRVRRSGRGWVPEGLERPVTLSNIDKVFFPDGTTKGDLVQYYSSVAPVLLPHLAGRPLSLSRYPDGIDGPSFYEKRAPSHRPPWMDTVPVPSESMGGTIPFLVASHRESLLWLANMACIEVHPFHSRAGSLDRPDWAVFDLDPAEGSTWDQVVSVARLVRVALDRLGLAGYPKLSGSRGIHVYVPLDPVHTFERVRRFVDAVGRLLAQAAPDDVTVEWDIPRRRGKVFVDANRNASGQTVAAVYSVRPLPGSPVSAPLRWEEVGILRNGDVTMFTLWDRLARVGDLFAPVLAGGQTLDAAERALGLV